MAPTRQHHHGDSEQQTEKHGLSGKTGELRQHVSQHVSERKEAFHEKAAEEVEVHGHEMPRGTVFKLIGLGLFFAIMAVCVALLWPYFHTLFEPGGRERVLNDVRDAGPVGVLMLLVMQFVQIVVAFIPGEVTQVAAGVVYGPWLGALIIMVGCVLSSAFIFLVVHRLGAPFVQGMVSTEHLAKIERFQESGKLNIVVFVLFLIPGLPKDVFTYLVPLTNMRMRTFLLLSNIGRIPGVLISTYAAGSLVDGNVVVGVVVFAVAAVIAVVGLALRPKIMAALERHGHRPCSQRQRNHDEGAGGQQARDE